VFTSPRGCHLAPLALPLSFPSLSLSLSPKQSHFSESLLLKPRSWPGGFFLVVVKNTITPGRPGWARAAPRHRGLFGSWGVTPGKGRATQMKTLALRTGSWERFFLWTKPRGFRLNTPPSTLRHEASHLFPCVCTTESYNVKKKRCCFWKKKKRKVNFQVPFFDLRRSVQNFIFLKEKMVKLKRDKHSLPSNWSIYKCERCGVVFKNSWGSSEKQVILQGKEND